MDRPNQPPGRARLNLPDSPSKKAVMDATNSWVESSSSLSGSTTSKGHKASQSINNDASAFRFGPSKNDTTQAIRGRDWRDQNSWAQNILESEHENSWAQEQSTSRTTNERQGLGLGFANAQAKHNEYMTHKKNRSVTDPALSTAETRGNTLKTLGTKIFKDRTHSDNKAPVDSFAAGLSSYAITNDKASRLLGAQHVVTSEDRTLLQLPGPAYQKPDGIIFSGSMSPTKSGTYGTIGKAQLQASNKFARVKSHQGLVATVEDDDENDTKLAPVTEFTSSAVYSPSIYGGVWEKHPSVNQTMPPYSPAQGFGARNYQDLLSGPGVRASMDERNSPRPSTFHESAEVLPLFTGQAQSSLRREAQNSFPATPIGTNSVPPHASALDASHTSPDAKLQQMEARLHHHFDICFDRLARSTTDKSDKVLDTIITKYEAFEEQLSRVAQSVNGDDASAIKNRLDALEQSLHTSAAGVTEIRRQLQNMHRTLGRLENEVVAYACKCEHGSVGEDTDEDPNPITFFDGHQNYTVARDGNRRPAGGPAQRNYQGWYDPTAGEAYRQNGQAGIPQIDGEVGTPLLHQDEDAGEAITAQIDQNGNLVQGNQEQGQVVYDLASFMRVTEDGQMVIDLPEEEIDAGPIMIRIDIDGNAVSGLPGPDQVTYDLPSFMTVNENGEIVINLEEDETTQQTESQTGTAARAVIPQLTQNGTIVQEDGEHDGVLYDLPSFMTVDENGELVIDIEEGDAAEQTELRNENTAQAAGPRINQNGDLIRENDEQDEVTYDLPSFMAIDNTGNIVINIPEEEGSLEHVEDIPADDESEEDRTDAETTSSDNTLADYQPAPGTAFLDQQGHAVYGAVQGGVVYDIPSFMHVFNDGTVIIDTEEDAEAWYHTPNGTHVAPSTVIQHA